MSAYFSEESSPREISSCYSSMSLQQKSAPTSFPLARRILWDRAPLSSPCSIRVEDVLPPLYLSKTAVKSFLGDCLDRFSEGQEHASLTSTGVVAPLCSISSNEMHTLKHDGPLRSVLGSSEYIMRVSPQGSSPLSSFDSCTIPVSCRPQSDTELSFDKSATAHLISNLSKAITTGGECSVRSCMRLRAAGRVNGNSDKINGSYRFEAILPEVSFSYVQIRNLPLLSTPLSLKLTSVNTSSDDSMSPRMGYLTLNQTRKVVPLLETDSAVNMAPIVGVWISGFDDIEEQNGNVLNHPFFWSACVRYFYNAKILDKAMIAENTFLVANFGSLSASYYEVTKLMSSSSSLSKIGNGNELHFSCYDFRVDLSVSRSDNDSIGINPVLGKFRPLSQVNLIRSFKNASGATATPDQINDNNEDRVDNNSKLASSVELKDATRRLVDLETESFYSESNTPLPRDVLSLPAQSPRSVNTNISGSIQNGDEKYANGDFGEIDDIEISQFSNLASADNDDMNYTVLTASMAGNNSTSYPAEIILAQQKEIEKLRNNVSMLQNTIISLGGAIPRETSYDPSIPPKSVPSLKEENLKYNLESSNEITTKVINKSESISPVVGRQQVSEIEFKEKAEEEMESRNSVSTSEPILMRLIRAERTVLEESGSNLDDCQLLKSSYSRINPLQSSSSNLPVLRLHSEEQSELMEPSVFSEQSYGKPAFPGPSMSTEDGEFVDDFDSDEDYSQSLESEYVSINSVSSSFSDSKEGVSMFESASILAIQAKYM